jgi:hypothetical protein
MTVRAHNPKLAELEDAIDYWGKQRLEACHLIWTAKPDTGWRLLRFIDDLSDRIERALDHWERLAWGEH